MNFFSFEQLSNKLAANNKRILLILHLNEKNVKQKNGIYWGIGRELQLFFF